MFGSARREGKLRFTVTKANIGWTTNHDERSSVECKGEMDECRDRKGTLNQRMKSHCPTARLGLQDGPSHPDGAGLQASEAFQTLSVW